MADIPAGGDNQGSLDNDERPGVVTVLELTTALDRDGNNVVQVLDGAIDAVDSAPRAPRDVDGPSVMVFELKT